MNRYDADSILWNWARWHASGPRVGNMLDVVPYDEEEEKRREAICVAQAIAVDKLHQTLPHHERMIVIAEYPQRHVRFAGLGARERREAAQRWVKAVTGVWLRESEYKLCLDLFKDLVGREVM